MIDNWAPYIIVFNKEQIDIIILTSNKIIIL